MVKAIVGANWGDEGKGKITDLLAEQSDVVIRFQGGANAGHTIICDYGKFALHLLPSGVFYPHVTNIIGNGVALDVNKFVAELRHLSEGGVPAPHVIVDQRTQLLMSYHVLLDTCEEARLAGEAFGSTHSGIAPFYSDKYAKIGIQVADLWNEERLKNQMSHICTLKTCSWGTCTTSRPWTPTPCLTSSWATGPPWSPMWGTAWPSSTRPSGRASRCCWRASWAP